MSDTYGGCLGETLQPIDFTWLFVKMLLALVVTVVAALIVLRYVVPNLSWTKKLQQNAYFRMLARFGLGPKHTLYLVKIGKKNLVLGTSESGIDKMLELSDEELEL